MERCIFFSTYTISILRQFSNLTTLWWEFQTVRILWLSGFSSFLSFPARLTFDRKFFHPNYHIDFCDLLVRSLPGVHKKYSFPRKTSSLITSNKNQECNKQVKVNKVNRKFMQKPFFLGCVSTNRPQNWNSRREILKVKFPFGPHLYEVSWIHNRC